VLVEEVMRKKVITIHPEQSVLEALQIIRANRIRHLPVTDANDLVGIVSDRDLRDVSPSVLTNEDTQLLQQTRIRQIMIEDVISVHPLDYLEDAAMLMYQHTIGCLPVIRQKRLIGIVTETDLLRALVELTGAIDPGSTLEIRVPERYGPLAEITQIIKAHKVSIASCFIRPDSSSQHRLITLRLRTIDPTEIISQIASAGYQMLRPFAKGEDKDE